MCNKIELNNILREIRKIYENVYGDKLVKVVLYGSYARGDFDSESDIDVAGIVREDRLKLQQLQKLVRKKSIDIDLSYGIYISPKAIPYNEFIKYKSSLSFYRNIIEEGVNIRAG